MRLNVQSVDLFQKSELGAWGVPLVEHKQKSRPVPRNWIGTGPNHPAFPVPKVGTRGASNASSHQPANSVRSADERAGAANKGEFRPGPERDALIERARQPPEISNSFKPFAQTPTELEIRVQ